MTTTTPTPTAALDLGLYSADELRQMADLLDLVGKTVQIVDVGGAVPHVGTLTTVYYTDGIAVNVVGLVDWSTEGKDYGRDFYLGPLGANAVVACPDAWFGYRGGRIATIYTCQKDADRALVNRYVEAIAPHGKAAVA